MRALIAVLALANCSLPPVVNVENAAALAQYERLLDDCKSRGKDAGSYAVYAACADEVDAHLCKEQHLRCPGDQ